MPGAIVPGSLSCSGRPDQTLIIVGVPEQDNIQEFTPGCKEVLRAPALQGDIIARSASYVRGWPQIDVSVRACVKKIIDFAEREIGGATHAYTYR